MVEGAEDAFSGREGDWEGGDALGAPPDEDVDDDDEEEELAVEEEEDEEDELEFETADVDGKLGGATALSEARDVSFETDSRREDEVALSENEVEFPRERDTPIVG